MAVINDTVFLISTCSCLVCNSATNFCMFILYPVTLLHLHTSFFFLLLVPWDSLCRQSCYSQTGGFTFPFLFFIPFISFSDFFALAGASSTMLEKRCESRHLCLVPDFRGKCSALRIMLLVLYEVVRCFFIKLRNFLSIPIFSESF